MLRRWLAKLARSMLVDLFRGKWGSTLKKKIKSELPLPLPMNYCLGKKSFSSTSISIAFFCHLRRKEGEETKRDTQIRLAMHKGKNSPWVWTTD